MAETEPFGECDLARGPENRGEARRQGRVSPSRARRESPSGSATPGLLSAHRSPRRTGSPRSSEIAEDAARRLAGVRQELAGAKRSLDRYFAAFEEGSLSPADCQERIAKLNARIDALIAEEASLTQRASEGATEAPSPVDVTEWAKDLGTLLRAGTVQQRMALFRLLVKELRVMSRDEILPTYKIPALVPAPEGQVDPRVPEFTG